MKRPRSPTTGVSRRRTATDPRPPYLPAAGGPWDFGDCPTTDAEGRVVLDVAPITFDTMIAEWVRDPGSQHLGLKRLAPHLGDRTFMLTWCDGLADVDLDRLLDFHRRHRRLATLTAVHPPARFGRVFLDQHRVLEFQEKTVDPDE